MKECHLYYSLEIERFLQKSGYNQIQIPASYWRRDVVFIDFAKKEYRFKAHESNPFNNIIDFDVLNKLIAEYEKPTTL